MSLELQARANPYASPETDAGIHPPSSSEPTASEVFLAWEKLRLYFNGILALELLIGTFVLRAGWLEAVEFGFSGALAANLGFCLGPVLEGYAALIGIPRTAARWIIFALGTLFAMSLPVGYVGFIFWAATGMGPPP